MLVKKSRARGYLTSTNKRKDSELADHKHKWKSQEGNTNLAIQGDIRALMDQLLPKLNERVKLSCTRKQR